MGVPVGDVPVGKLPKPGEVVVVSRRASVQFVRPVRFRVIRVISEWHTFDGWVWLHGYQLDERGNAVAKRDVFVQPAGLLPTRPSAVADSWRRPRTVISV